MEESIKNIDDIISDGTVMLDALITKNKLLMLLNSRLLTRLKELEPDNAKPIAELKESGDVDGSNEPGE